MLPIWGLLSIYAYTLSLRTTNLSGNTCGEGCVPWGQSSLPYQETGVPAVPNFLLLLYLCLHPLTQNDQIRQGGRGVFFGGQPRHCMCTSASRGISATAEFVVCFRLTVDDTTKHLCMAESENSRVSVPLLVKRYCPRLMPLPTSFHFGRTIYVSFFSHT